MDLRNNAQTKLQEGELGEGQIMISDSKGRLHGKVATYKKIGIAEGEKYLL